jgi:hypothetical protein
VQADEEMDEYVHEAGAYSGAARALAPTPRVDLAYMRPIALRTHRVTLNSDFGQRTA